MAGIAGFVLVERVAPPILRVRYAAALGRVGWGTAILLGAGG